MQKGYLSFASIAVDKLGSSEAVPICIITIYGKTIGARCSCVRDGVLGVVMDRLTVAARYPFD